VTKKLNIEEVAQYAGVSTATVSRVINNYPFVKEETRRKVLRVIRETNYQVNAVARSLRRRKTHSVGVIISNVLSSFYSIIAKAVEDVAIGNKFCTVLCNGGDDPEKELNYLRVLHENRVDGVILSPTGENREFLEFLITSGIPVVVIDRTVEGLHCDTVLVNNREASCEAVRYMLRKGYRRIGCISGPKDRLTGMERFRGFLDAHKLEGVPVDEDLIGFGDFLFESGAVIARKLLDMQKLDAIYAVNTDMATGAYTVIRERGLAIPNDIAFLMFDDPDWTSLVTPGVTAIRQPVYALGNAAADLMFKRILEGGSYSEREPVSVVLEARLIRRESV
jgi:DNA-binding LacI/PurR family transcriptional regulator